MNPFKQHPAEIAAFLAITMAACVGNPFGGGRARGQEQMIIEDFSDIVTHNDLGMNDWSGNMGVVNPQGYDLGRATIVPLSPGEYALEFAWDFSKTNDLRAFTGFFVSLFGRTDVEMSLDGVDVRKVDLPLYSLDFNDLDGGFGDPCNPRKAVNLGFELSYEGESPVDVTVEIKDVDGGRGAVRAVLQPLFLHKTFRVDFRNEDYGQACNMQKAKVLTFVVKRGRIPYPPGITNPDKGRLVIHRLWLTCDKPEPQPADDDQLLDLLERRCCQYFVDWGSRHVESFGVPQDRSTFPDLLTVGGVGFAIPSLVISAEHQWLPRSEAIQRVLGILRTLGEPQAWGPEAVGRVGYHGWFYHFLGMDGRRKRNFDYPATPQNEALNTVEVSAIDTGLALMGVLVAQSYFDRNSPDEQEIRRLAQQIYEQVDWAFMLEPARRQWYLGWKPSEQHDGPEFRISDSDGLGHYSGKPGYPATLDYFTDEAILLNLLYLGSQTDPISTETACSLIFQKKPESGVVASWPGALFTYFFLHAFLDTRTFDWPGCGHTTAVNLYENSRKAFLAAIDYARDNPAGIKTYGMDRWGIGACEGPDDAYRAYGAPPIAITGMPDQDGTVTYYSMLSAVSFGEDLRQKAIDALRLAWDCGHWHARWGLPDAFHADVSSVSGLSPGKSFRQSGPWVNRALFAIDVGPMALHIENSRTGKIWSLLAGNPNIRRAMERLSALRRPAVIVLEAERGSGEGELKHRSNASGGQTVWLHAGEIRKCSFSVDVAGRYGVEVRYSNDNDNAGPSEAISVVLDGRSMGTWPAADTGDYGHGWNVFAAQTLDPIPIAAGPHEIRVTVSGGDGYGVEIDRIQLTAE